MIEMHLNKQDWNNVLKTNEAPGPGHLAVIESTINSVNQSILEENVSSVPQLNPKWVMQKGQ